MEYGSQIIYSRIDKWELFYYPKTLPIFSTAESSAPVHFSKSENVKTVRAGNSEYLPHHLATRRLLRHLFKSNGRHDTPCNEPGI